RGPRRAPPERPPAPRSGAWRVSKTGPWGQGPVFLQQLALLAGFDLRAVGPQSPDFIHTVVECAKLAFADREAWYGDPRFVPDLTADLLSPPYNEERRGLVAGPASNTLRPGSPAGSTPRLPSWTASRPGEGEGLGDPTMS